jgi:hypothetical protein
MTSPPAAAVNTTGCSRRHGRRRHEAGKREDQSRSVARGPGAGSSPEPTSTRCSNGSYPATPRRSTVYSSPSRTTGKLSNTDGSCVAPASP